jgi:hypothetical protein
LLWLLAPALVTVVSPRLLAAPAVLSSALIALLGLNTVLRSYAHYIL